MDNVNEKKLNKIWGSVGFIIHLAQLIEYNLVNIIAGHKFLKDIDSQKIMTIDEYEKRAQESNEMLHNIGDGRTMGYVVNIAKDLHLFDDELAKRISVIKDKRDYYAHRFFKEQLFAKEMENNPGVLLNQLSQDVDEMYAINGKLLEIDAQQRCATKEIKKKMSN